MLSVGLVLGERFELAVERVAFAHQHVPPPLGTLDTGSAEHVQKLGSGIRRKLLEVIAHGAELCGWELDELMQRTIAAMQSFAPDRDTIESEADN